MSLENIINDYLDGIGLKLQDPSDKALTYFHEKKQLKHKYSSMELTDSTESIQDDDVGSDNSLKERLTLKRNLESQQTGLKTDCQIECKQPLSLLMIFFYLILFFLSQLIKEKKLYFTVITYFIDDLFIEKTKNKIVGQ
ncbi:hypothetical protein pb186bvf_012364 [Paramecium bursaria]